ncbi:MAG: hypothetical protein ACRDSO_00315 [Pseudonocardiaceae bacterium]
MSGPRVEIPAVCEKHGGFGGCPGSDGERLVLDGCADHCCVLALERAAAAVLVDAVAEGLE